MHIRCPICEHSIQALTPRKREEHCLACLENPPKRAKTEEIVLDAEIKSEIKAEAVERQTLERRTLERRTLERRTLERRTLESTISPSQVKAEHTSEARPAARKKSSMPSYKTINIAGTKIAVDAFKYGAIPGVTSYFLSHFHSDHYGGLSKSWKHGVIYCTASTARLAELKLKVSPEYLKPLELNREYTIEGIKVILLDANHCPGAAVFLFNHNILHTGDFRATEELIGEVRQWTPELDTLFLDTTYLDPVRKFPSQDLVVNVCAAYCKHIQQLPMPKRFFTETPQKRKVLAVVGTYTIGKERLAISIAKQLNTKIWCTQPKRTVMDLLGSQQIDELLCDNGYDAQVHLASMGELTISKIEQNWQHLRKHFTHIIAFIPTGWTWRGKSAEFTEKSLEDSKTCTTRCEDTIRICRVPYSEHSSYTELENFCRTIRCKTIIPTVHTKHGNILRHWEAI